MLDNKETGGIISLRVPITNQSQGNLYRDLNELLAKNCMPELNIAGHMHDGLNLSVLSIAPSAQTHLKVALTPILQPRM